MQNQLNLFEGSSPSVILNNKRCFIALDIEATGLSQENDKVIEIGIVRFDDEKIIDKYQTFINPQQDIPHEVSKLTGITYNDVKDAPTLDQVQHEIKKFIGDLPIVGHFISFDVNFLNFHGLDLKNQTLDTCELARIMMPNELSYNLEILAEKLNIVHQNAHRALEDTLATVDVFWALQNKIKTTNPKVLQQLCYILNKGENPWKEELMYFNQSITNNECIEYKINGNETVNEPLFLQNAISFSKHSTPNIDLHEPSYYLDTTKLTKFIHKNHFSKEETLFLLKLTVGLDEFGKKKEKENENKIFSKDFIKLPSEENVLWKNIAHSFNSLSQTNLLTDLKEKKEIHITDEFVYELLQEKTNNIKCSKLTIKDVGSFVKGLANVEIEYISLQSLTEDLEDEALQNKLTMLFGLIGIFYQEIFGDSKHEMILGLMDFQHAKYKQIKNLIFELISEVNLPNEIKNKLNIILNPNLNKFLYSIYLTKKEDIIFKAYPTSISNVIEQLNSCSSEIEIATNYSLTNQEKTYIQNFLGENVNFTENTANSKIKLNIIKDFHDKYDMCINEIYEEIERNLNETTDMFIVTNTDTNIKNIYLDLIARKELNNFLITAQNNSGSQGKIKSFWAKSTNQSRIIICKFDFLLQFLNTEFNQNNKILCIHKLPFDNIKTPIYKIWSEKFDEPFRNFTIPRLNLLLKTLISNFNLKFQNEKHVYFLDNRIKEYDGSILNSLSDLIEVTP